MRYSIRWRLTVYQIAVLSVAMVIVAIAGENSVRGYYLARLETHLSRQASLIRHVLRSDLIDGVPAERIHERVRALGYTTAARITIIAPDGTVLSDSKYKPSELPNLAQRPEVAALLNNPQAQPRYHTQAIRPDGMHVALPLSNRHRTVAVVRLSLSLSELDKQLWDLCALFLGVVLLTTVAAVVVTLYGTRSITGPILEVTEVAQRMAAGDLTQRVIVRPEDEIGQLTRSFNTMAARIQDMMDELDRERQKMAQVFTQMTDGLVVADASARIVLMNPAAERILGAAARQAVGQTLADAFNLPDLTRVAAAVLHSGQEQYEQIFRGNPDEQVIEVCGSAVAERPGISPGVMLVLRDWTEAWHTERMRRELVANASHELRTPIASLKMMTETLLAGAQEEPEVRTRFLTLVAREADRLSDLVCDLLDLSRMDADRWRLDIEPFALREVVDQVLSKYLVVAQERRQHLSGKCPPDLYLLADKRALQQILGNLIENAIKYTAKGGEIRLMAEERGGRGRVSVHDTGIGIPPEHLGRIFERFYRVDKARSRELGGTGLGLAIVKSLVEAQHGTVEVESELNRGSTFTVSLPLPDSIQKEPVHSEEAACPHQTV